MVYNNFSCKILFQGIFSGKILASPVKLTYKLVKKKRKFDDEDITNTYFLEAWDLKTGNEKKK